MHFFRQTLLYMTFEVAEPAWRRFQAALATAATVDQVGSIHVSCGLLLRVTAQRRRE